MAPTTPPPYYDSPTMGDGQTDLPCPTLHFHVTFSTFPTSSAWLCSTTLLDVKCGSLGPVINYAMNSITFFRLRGFCLVQIFGTNQKSRIHEAKVEQMGLVTSS